MKRLAATTLALVAAAWVAYGLFAWRARAARLALPSPAAAAQEVRGAWHVHTRASDGRGSLDDVVRAAGEAGLAFVVVTDHNLRVPERPEYRGGVLVVPATEASTRWGHVAALSVPRALTPAERADDPLAAIAALGGAAVLAHPLHPRRPFSAWGRGPWQGLEVVSNDTAWHRAVADRALGRVVSALSVLPWDPPRAVLALADDPSDELARFDAAPGRTPGAPEPVLFCSADAHGYPSYRAAFEAFSMHVPVRLTGDAADDAGAVSAALVDGRASCVFDAIMPAAGIRLEASAGPPRRLALGYDVAGPVEGARFVLWRAGARLGERDEALAAGPGHVDLAGLCGAAGCGPGAYRVSVEVGGRAWIFTNPVRIE